MCLSVEMQALLALIKEWNDEKKNEWMNEWILIKIIIIIK